MKTSSWFIFGLGLSLFGSFCGYADETNYTAVAREFTARSLADTNVFVYNPPADLNPYTGMSKESVQGLQKNAMQNGSVLFLYLNGLPAKIESRKSFKEHGFQKTWFPDGRTRSEEYYDNGKLMTGTYLNETGLIMSTISQGNGRKIIYSEPLDRNNERVRGFTDYLSGVKDGLEVHYSNYEKKQKSAEAHYHEGKLHGEMTQWMPTGEKNLEMFFKDGKQSGNSTCWYLNGQIQSRSLYLDGNQVGSWTRYYENGIKAQEVSSNCLAQWYPSGKLMLQKTLGVAGKVITGSSFDALGNQNGSVSNWVGSLIEGEDVDRHGNYRLFVFEKDRPFQSVMLPRPRASYNTSSNTAAVTVSFGSFDKGLDDVTLTLLLPQGSKSQGSLSFVVDHLRSGGSTNLGPTTITLPQPWDQWSGKVLIDVQAVVDGRSVRYQHHLFDDFPKPQEMGVRPRVEKKQAPRREAPFYIGNNRPGPTVEGKTLPPYDQATDYWRLGDVAWVLYKEPALLLISADGGQTWRIARHNFPYRPCGLYVRSGDAVIVWGVKPTVDVSNGITHFVEESKDGCKSWSTFIIPKCSFLLGIGGNDDVMMISAIRIPKEGIPPDKDWFELPRATFLSQDSTNFSEVVGPSLLDISTIKAKSTAPNQKFRAFLSVSSWLDTSYSLYMAKSLDEVPVPILNPCSAGEFVWSGNSRILALKSGTHFIAYVDTAANKSGKVSFSSEDGASEKQKEELSALDMVVKDLLDSNPEQ